METYQFHQPEIKTKLSPINQLIKLRELGIKTSAIEKNLIQECDIPDAFETAVKGSLPTPNQGK